VRFIQTGLITKFGNCQTSFDFL